MNQLRLASATVAARSRHVAVDQAAIATYAASLPLEGPRPAPDPEAHLLEGGREELAAFWLTLDAINFGSGWFPTLRKEPGRSGYFTVAIGVRRRFAADGPWSAGALAALDAAEIARALGQDPDHELMELYARSLRDLGRHVSAPTAAGSAPSSTARAAPPSRWPRSSGRGRATPTAPPTTS